MRAGVDAFGEAVLGRGLGDRVGLVRVSTQSEIVLPLTDDPDAWSAAVDGLTIANGWTALWDGVRLGNEVLEAGATAAAGTGLEVCLSQARRSVVVFTDGQENNSADEHATSYPGDGIDTTLDDLEQLHVLGIPTPVWTVGIGDGVDEDALAELAARTGGAYTAIDGYAELASTLTATAEGLSDEIPVCFEAASCDHTEGLVLVVDGEESFEATFSLPALCADGDDGSGDGGATGDGGCTRTRGYWSTHEDDWPVDHLTLGDRDYDRDACLDILGAPTRGDKSLQLASQLIAAKLNVAAGADDADVASTIGAADAWLVDHDDGDGVPLGVGDWDGAEEIKDALDAWNNGDSGPGHCD
ncbi:MAG: VWA domain-containing protein [Deltaproteobacteria bacterium]|nr:MAG: VWA domain-containing protein [Deltaproteobacteria bacterium]